MYIIIIVSSNLSIYQCSIKNLMLYDLFLISSILFKKKMFLYYIILSLIITLSFIYGCIFINVRHIYIKKSSLCITLVCLILSLLELITFNRSILSFQDVTTFVFNENSFNTKVCYAFGVDGVSIFFVILTTILTPMCLLTSWKTNFKKPIDFFIYFLLLELFLVLSFTALDLISFFIFFESILIPMFFIIGVWGSRHRRVKASFLLFLYTLCGSIFFFFSILVLYSDIGTTSFTIVSKTNSDFVKQCILWLFIFIAFSIKIPTIPLHTWLPEAHVEAPTSGSVMLAGLLLKLGGYGFIRVLLPLCKEATIFYLPLVDMFAMISIIYASLVTIRQVDLKRIIAYSSVAHMNLVVLGIFSGNIQGILGSIFLMLAHGVVSSALFFCIGILYDKYKTRLLFYYGGLTSVMPVYSILFLIFSLANTGIPGSINFIGELVVFIGLIDKNFFVTLISITGIILSVIYSIFLYNRIIFGNLKVNYINCYKDVTYLEFSILIPLACLTILVGLHPNVVLDTLLASTSLLVEKSKWTL